MKSVILGIICLWGIMCVSCQSKSKDEGNLNNAELEAFIERYSFVDIGEPYNVSCANDMPSYSNVQKEYDRSIEKMKAYLTDVYADEKGELKDILADKRYQRLLVDAEVNASMIKFYRLTGSYLSKGLSITNAKEIEVILNTRKELVDKLIEEGSDMDSGSRSDFLLVDAYGKKLIHDLLPSDVPKSVVVNGYAWNDGVISYIKKNRE